MRFNGEKLVALRNERAERYGKSKTQMDLEIAAQTGIAHSTLQRWKTNKTKPSGEDIMKLARACEVDPDYFFDAAPADPFSRA